MWGDDMEGLRIGKELRYVRDENDFAELIREYMGYDAYQYFMAKMQDRTEDTNAMAYEIMDAIDRLNEAVGTLEGICPEIH